MNGIDVSSHNGVINWSEVKASGVDFAIIRAGYGRLAVQADQNFIYNYNSAKLNGIHVGAYWYSYATTPKEAVEEAKACIQVLGGRMFNYPIYYDVEEKSVLATGKNNVSNMIKAFCKTLEDHGYYAGVYTSASVAKTHLTEDIAKNYTMWIAHWGVSKPGFDIWDVWQKSEKGACGGIKGHVDLDFSNKDFPAIMAATGLNNNPKTEVTPIVTVPEEPAKRTIDVTTTINGVTYKGTLTEV